MYMSEYLTLDSVAELFGKKRKAIEKMVERRLIPFGSSALNRGEVPL
jgi:hypothetical protein